MSDEQPLAPPRTSSSGRRLSRHKKETKEPDPEHKPVRLARTGSLGERRHHRAASMLPGSIPPLSSPTPQDVEMVSLSTPTSPLPRPDDVSSIDDRLPRHHGNKTNTNSSTSTSAENLTTTTGTRHTMEAAMGGLASATLVLATGGKKLKPSVNPAMQRSKSEETCCSSSTTSSMTITNSSGSSSENIRVKTTTTATSKNDRSRYTDYRDGLASRNTQPFDDVNFCFVCKAEFELDTSLPTIVVNNNNNNTDSSSSDELLGPVNPESTCGRLLASGQLITLVAAAGFKLQLDRGSLPIYRQVFLCSACHSDLLSPRSARKNTWPQPSGNNISLLGRALSYFS